jgi:hypothetical protein
MYRFPIRDGADAIIVQNNGHFVLESSPGSIYAKGGSFGPKDHGQTYNIRCQRHAFGQCKKLTFVPYGQTQSFLKAVAHWLVDLPAKHEDHIDNFPGRSMWYI